jgi:hypothetical protein
MEYRRPQTPWAQLSNRRTVNSKLETYLTDFLESRFAGENAKNRALCAKTRFNAARVYHFQVNHAPALPKKHRAATDRDESAAYWNG